MFRSYGTNSGVYQEHLFQVRIMIPYQVLNTMSGVQSGVIVFDEWWCSVKSIYSVSVFSDSISS